MPEQTRTGGLLAALLMLLPAAGCGQQGPGDTAPPPAQAAQTNPQAAPAAVAPAARPVGASLPDFTALVQKVGPAVVNVTTTSKARTAGVEELPDDQWSEFFRRFFPNPPGGSRGFRTRGQGSGFIISQDGYVLTNAHVVADAATVSVKLADAKREFTARVVGLDRRTDVALLKVDATGLPVAPLGHSERLAVGEWVAAIGSPFGFANTITAGIVSGKERSLPDESFVPFIQTDVAVNPGNSGGPLLNLNGEVVGINSQIYSRTGGYMGVSFAIPIEVAMEVAEQIRTQGRVTRGRLGVSIQEVTQELAQSFGLDSARGVLVASVEPNGPAAKAGLRSGDVILEFGGQAIAKANDLPRLVASAKPGSQVPITLWRDGATRQITAVIGETPPDSAAERAAPASGMAPNRLGLVVRELSPAERQALQIQYGLVVEDAQGAAAETPLRRGDVIVAIANQPFSSFEEFNRRVAEAPPGSYVPLRVRRGEATLYVPIRVGPAPK